MELSRSQNAISNLTSSIPRAKMALKSHQESLASFRDVLSKLSLPELRENINMNEETETSKLYEDLAKDVKSNVSRGTATLEAQISAFEEETQKLQYHQNRLDDEMIGWKFTRDLSQKAIEHFTAIQNQLTSDLGIAKVAISPIRRIPKEVWIKIFRYCIDEGFRAYTMQSNAVPYRSTSFILSAVCQSWRNVLSTEGKMWQMITIHPSAHISVDEQDVLSSCLRRVRSPFTFISNLSQTLSWTWNNNSYYYGGHYQDPNYNLRSNNAPFAIMHPYTLYLVMNEDSSNTIRRASNVPFRGTNVLKVHIRSSQANNGLSGLFPYFSTVENLQLNLYGAHIPQLVTLTSALSSLRHLNLDVQDMPSIDMTLILGTNLETLRIRYTGQSDGPRLNNSVNLAQLRVLGLTYPSSSFIENLRAPKIHELEFYESSRNVSDSGYLRTSISVITKLHQISFIDWKTTSSYANDDITDGAHVYIDVVSIFAKLAPSMYAMQSIRFSGCNVNGRHLIDTMKGLADVDNGPLKHLQTIQVSKCDGITIEQCEELRLLAPELQVYT